MIFPIGYRRRQFRYYGTPANKPASRTIPVLASIALFLAIPALVVILAICSK